jgi:hypothetical protein
MVMLLAECRLVWYTFTLGECHFLFGAYPLPVVLFRKVCHLYPNDRDLSPRQ